MPFLSRRRKSKPRRLLVLKRLGILLGAVLLLGVIGFGVHRVQLDRQATVLLERARAAATEKNHPVAYDLYSQYLQFRPKDDEALAERIEQLQELVKAEPRRMRELLVNWEQLLVIAPGREDQRLKLATLYSQRRNFSAARKHLDFLATTSSKINPEVHVLLARAYWSEQQFTQAKEQFQLALATGTAPVSTTYEFAVMLRESRAENAAQDAEKLFQTLLTAKPQDIEARIARARYRDQFEDRRGAREDLELAYTTLPNAKTHIELCLLLTQQLAQADDLKGARAILEPCYQAHPADFPLTLAYAEILARLNDRPTAIKLLRAISDSLPSNDLRLLDVGDRLLDLADTQGGLAVAQRLERPQENIEIVAYLRGRAAEQAGNWPEAIPLLRKAAPTIETLNRLFGLKTYLTLARCYERANNLDQQDEAYSNALRLDEKSTPALFGRASTQAQLGKLDEAARIYQSLAISSQLARLQLIRIRFQQAMSQPTGIRNWQPFDQAFSSGIVPAEAEILKAVSLYFRGQPDESAKLLTKIVKSPNPPAIAWANLAILQGMTGNDDGFTTLDQAEKALGPSVDLRLARAQLLARNPSPKNVQAIVALADPTKIPEGDRYRLNLSLGQLLLSLKQTAAAVPLIKQAAALSPYDMLTRLILLDTPGIEPATQSQALAELRTIDGENGPTFLAVSVTRELQQTPTPTPPQLQDWTERIQRAQQQRPNWGRLSSLLGDLATLKNLNDAALNHYRHALNLGERNEALVKRTVKLLMERQAEAEALQVLARAAGSGSLTNDLQQQWNAFQSAAQSKQDLNLAWAESTDMVNSTNYLDHLLRARVLIAHQKLKEAQSALGKALEVNPEAPETYALIVRFLMMTEQPDAAKTWAAKARAKFADPATKLPDEPTRIPLMLATIAEVLRDLPEAVQQYQKLRTLRPDDLDPVQRLYRLYLSTNQRQQAEQFLQSMLTSGNGAQIRWARRTQAVELAGKPEQFRNLPQALELLDRNLAEGNNAVVDIRARAFLQGIDPAQRKQAIARIIESTVREGLTQDDLYFLAKMQSLAGDTDLAIRNLQEATRYSGTASPDALALLTRILITTDKLTEAKLTLGRLKLAAPESWIAAAEEARYWVAMKDEIAAARVVLACPACKSAEGQASLASPHLESLGLIAPAEAALRQGLAEGLTQRKPEAIITLASFLARQGKGKDAVALVTQHREILPVGIAARLYAAAVQGKKLPLVPEAEQPAWREEILAVERWVSQKLEAAPQNEELLAAAAELADANGRHEDALTLYEKALPLSGGSLRAVIQNNLATLLTLLRKTPEAHERALDLVKSAMNTLGPIPSLLDTRALIFLMAGRQSEALQELEYALWGEKKPAFYFHQAQALTRLEQAVERRAALDQAKRLGLSRTHLHPLEWPAYTLLVD